MLRDESNRLTHEKAGLAERVKENHEKIKLNNQVRLGRGWVAMKGGRGSGANPGGTRVLAELVWLASFMCAVCHVGTSSVRGPACWMQEHSPAKGSPACGAACLHVPRPPFPR